MDKNSSRQFSSSKIEMIPQYQNKNEIEKNLTSEFSPDVSLRLIYNEIDKAMATMDYMEDNDKLNIICVHPGWMRTNEGNAAAPNDPYDSAETMRLLFEKKRNDKTGPRFVTFEDEEYPW